MILLGITGVPGAGKSLAAEYFKRQGAIIISGDDTGREVLKEYPAVLNRLAGAFGNEILDADGKLDRGALGRIVFGNPKALKKLNAIIHPHLLKLLKKKIEKYRKSRSSRIVVVDAALIFEWGIEKWFDYVLVVKSNRINRIERMMDSGLTRKEAEGRSRSQIPQREKVRRADFVIANDDTRKSLKSQVDSLLKSIRS